MSSTLGSIDRRRIFHIMLGSAGWAAMKAAEPKVSTPSYNTLSEREEVQLGQKFGNEYERQIEIIRHPLVDSYIEGIVKRLAGASQRPQWPFQVKLVNSFEINARALPGGRIYINRGLLDFVADENEMVGAVAHEIGHVVGRHTTNKLMALFIARNLYEQVRNSLGLDNTLFARILQELGGPVVMLAQMKYSRENESEADLLGFYEMFRAGWHPNGLLKFFTRLEKIEQQQSAVGAMFSDHPSTPERVRIIQQELDAVRITAPLKEQSSQFHAVKATLGQFPRPKGATGK